MLELKIDEHTYTCEGSYNELSKKRLLQLMRIICGNTMNGAKMMSTVLFFLQPKRYSDAIRKLLGIDAKWIHTICTDESMLGWVFMENALLTEYTVKGFWHRGVYYYGPPKRMLRISALEYVASRQAYAGFKTSGQNIYLDELIALLYRPVNLLWWLKLYNSSWTGDKRMALNDYTKNKRVKKFETLPPELKAAIAKQYSGALNVFEKKFPMIYNPNASGGSGETQWTDMLFAMSGGIFGTLRDTENTDVTEMHIKMEADIKQNLKQKDQLSKRP